MKKIICVLMCCCLLLCSVSAFAANNNIIINGEQVVIPADMGQVREVDNRLFVPLRFVTEFLGCVVNYQETISTENGVNLLKRTATITNPETGISYFVTVGDSKLFILTNTGAKIIKMDTKVFVNEEEGRMYVPLRFLAEALNYTVSWDAASQTASLSSN